MRYDLHMHTTNSDGKNTVDEMCQAAVERGMGGIAITDHADMNFYEARNTAERIRRSIADVALAREKYADELTVLCGVELGEYLYAPEKAKEILALTGYDVILCSVHLVPKARWPMPYNRIPFDVDGTDEELSDYLGLYFELLSETVDSFDFDVLAHITCPIRYMTHKYGRTSYAMQHMDRIQEILTKVIERDIALEYNVGGFQHQEEVFALYRSLGGTRITLGSDAHSGLSIGRQFETVAQKLKELGFEHCSYYRNRIAYDVKL